MPTPPQLTPDIAAVGAAASRAANERRNEVCAQLAAGELTFDLFLDVASIDPPLARMRLLKAIRSMPLWNQRTATDLLVTNGISTAARVGWLIGPGAARKDRLLEQVVLGPGRRPPLPHAWPVHGRCDWIERTD